MKSAAIVDVQGFKTDNNGFIVKEIAIFFNDQMLHLLIQPPFPLHNLTISERKQVWWIQKNRKIYWDQGFIPYKNYLTYIEDILDDKTIYCKGVEKVTWIKKIFDRNDVINLENMNCPKLLNLYEDYRLSSDVFNCVYHPTICALKNVSCLRKWCLNKNII